MMSDNLRGALAMMAAMAGFALNDGLMKLAFETMPVLQSVFLRGIASSLLLLALAAWTGALAFRPTRVELRFLLARSIAEVGAVATFLTALDRMPLANATAVLQAAPLAVTMGAALFLRETVGWRRWSAVAAGFVGVVIMVRPGTDAFDWNALLPLATVGFITFRDLITSRMAKRVPTLFAATLTSVIIMLAAGVASPVQGWQPVTGLALACYAGAAGLVVIAYIFSVTAVRIGDMSAVSPFRYTVLLWALLIGILFFAEVPDVPTLVGAAIVVAAGLYTLWREHRVAVERSRLTGVKQAPPEPVD